MVIETAKDDDSMNTYTLSSSSKRRRILSPYEHERRKNIKEIPLEPLVHVASFLPTPSRAMFALALYPDFNRIAKYAFLIRGRGNDVCDGMKKIIGKSSHLNFGEIEGSLARRLNDFLIEDILLCMIRGDNELKRIRLTNCINVIGTGLRPLMNSTSIEQIDLSIVPDYTNPKEWAYQDEVQLSFYCMLDILVSITKIESSLKHLHFPWCWSKQWGVEAFIKRYKKLWSLKQCNCSQCTVQFTPTICTHICEKENTRMQIDTCSNCLKNICEECNEDVQYQLMEHCDRCDRTYCADCSEISFCTSCDDAFCLDTCGRGRVRAKHHCADYEECSGCTRKLCGRCVFKRTCVSCDEVDCGECRVHTTYFSRALDPLEEEEVRFRSYVEGCDICSRNLCRSCVKWTDCGDCSIPLICQDCVQERTCSNCDGSFCSGCRSIVECKRCHKNWCSDCDPLRAWGRDGRDGYCIECAMAVSTSQ